MTAEIEKYGFFFYIQMNVLYTNFMTVYIIGCSY